MPITFNDNGTTFLLMIVPMVLAMIAQSSLKNTYNKYLQLRNSRGVSGAQAARDILDAHGLQNVSIGVGKGFLTDYFDPRSNHINLSPEVYNGYSVASVAVAAHEVGHAIQHAEKYPVIDIRNKVLPVASLASNLSWMCIMIGLFSSFTGLLWLGAAMLAVILLFQVLTLPLEFDASKRAVTNLQANGLIIQTEVGPAKAVLKAAAMTYVVGVLAALANLLRIIIIANRRN
ncbi:zinc metallopeptidase [Mycoplasma sp. P36-A1]|uniref:zinc metallopeptidase n=1 Tax=Mycoplasma sp. P36-A1 TaxID=3252900 RepID=UPI003C2B9EA5